MTKEKTFSFIDSEDEKPRELRKSKFAELAGVSAGRISQLLAQGLPQLPNGKIPVEEGLAWIRGNLDPSRSKARTVPAASRPTHADGDSHPSLVNLKTEHERVKVASAKLRLKKEAGALIDRDTVERALFAWAKAERDLLMAWVMRIAPEIAAEIGCDPGDLYRALDREVRAHLQSLADTHILEGLE